MTTTQLKVSEAAALAGVSDDTVRRWAESGRLDLVKGPSGPQVVDGAQLARLLQELSTESSLTPTSKTSTRNRLVGIVTRVTKDGVMAQVDLQAGPFRIVSLISREAVDELGIEVGTVAAATVKATSVSISLP
ncbi:MAG TPA: TOBE domain-containing protein [Galbitalea sp.]|jgi:molybdopterin-binding protein|nr:TOBE domain-containing protein [Galbitalea sp.]